MSLSMSLSLNDSFAGQSILGCRFLPFITLYILCYSLLPCKGFAENSASDLMGVPLYVTSCFQFAAFNILSLSLIFAFLIIVCLRVVPLGLIIPGLSVLAGPGLSYFLSQVREFFSYSFFKCVLCPLFLSSPPGTLIMQMLVSLMMSQRSLKLYFKKKNNFFFFPFSVQTMFYCSFFQFADSGLCIT